MSIVWTALSDLAFNIKKGEKACFTWKMNLLSIFVM